MSDSQIDESLLKEGIYLCDTNDYRVIDNLDDKNLIFIFKEHDLPENDIEIGVYSNVKYYNENNEKYILFID